MENPLNILLVPLTIIILYKLIVYIFKELNKWYISNTIEVVIGYKYMLPNNKREIEKYRIIGKQMVEIIHMDYSSKFYPNVLLTVKTINNEIYKVLW